MKSLTGSGVTHLWTKIVEYVTGLGYTSNTGTVTGVTMNSGSTISPDANGVVNLGTVITDISSKQNVIDSSHKLSADLIEDGTTNKVINVKPNWNASSGDAAEILNKPTIPTVPSNIVTGTSSSYTIWVGTQAQYEAISTKDATTIYLITGS